MKSPPNEDSSYIDPAPYSNYEYTMADTWLGESPDGVLNFEITTSRVPILLVVGKAHIFIVVRVRKNIGPLLS